MSVLHLVILQGGGDTTIKLVTKDQFLWINQPYSVGKASSWTERDPSDDHEVNVTCGSGDNDRALQANGLEFESMVAAFAFAKQHGHLISPEEFCGCIY
jgi:hypothetical protein